MWILKSLGDVLGPLLYLGRCDNCGTQFMSRNDRVWVRRDAGMVRCERCGKGT